MRGVTISDGRLRGCYSLRAWGLTVCLMGLVVTTTAAWAEPDDPGERNKATAFDCGKLKNQAMPNSPDEWFERSLWANHCYIFEARAVRIGPEGIRTLALSHDIEHGEEHNVARLLDGPPIVFERRGRIGLGGWSGENANPVALPSAIMRHLDDHYRLSLSGEERIAGRPAQRLDIEPLDDMRYGHRLWLDKQTALPLKRMLINERGQMLETFQITDLEEPRVHGGEVILDEQRVPPEDPWRLNWLPPGYRPLPVAPQRSMHRTIVEQRLFSDGLSDISLFVESIQGEEFMLAPGLHRLGISYAAVRHIEVDNDPMQIIALGELPPEVLLKIIDEIVWSPDATNGDEAP
ncbi:negative regulator for alginate biosynthesis MucB [Pistricoccus aurantiacus]|uniref:Negative regulator for alginate biosynthesis MucB n=2 Tax=Pistricoccus aurantiacus TaxID=1883414 RepID=A0A5B8SZL6_9GAMM|nr:negative regulator for alginate biosynthesis MucB [Pistricoccus aurantiacus]